MKITVGHIIRIIQLMVIMTIYMLLYIHISKIDYTNINFIYFIIAHCIMFIVILNLILAWRDWKNISKEMILKNERKRLV